MAVALGGRIAEELIFGEDDITTGASGDFQQVRRERDTTTREQQLNTAGHTGQPFFESPDQQLPCLLQLQRLLR